MILSLHCNFRLRQIFWLSTSQLTQLCLHIRFLCFQLLDLSAHFLVHSFWSRCCRLSLTWTFLLSIVILFFFHPFFICFHFLLFNFIVVCFSRLFIFILKFLDFMHNKILLEIVANLFSEEFNKWTIDKHKTDNPKLYFVLGVFENSFSASLSKNWSDRVN